MAESPVIIALNRKYGELKGQLQKHQHEARKIQRNMGHVEATIRLFRADHEFSAIPAIAPNKGTRWKGKGVGIRMAIDAMREATEPLTTYELASMAMTRAGIPTDDLQAVRDVACSMRQSLKRRVGRGVVVVDGFPTRWALG